MTPWMLVSVTLPNTAFAQGAENADGAVQTEPAIPEPAIPETASSETVADPGAIPEGGFIGNDSYGAIPLGSGWGYVWAVYIATWLTLAGYAGYLALRSRAQSTRSTP